MKHVIKSLFAFLLLVFLCKETVLADSQVLDFLNKYHADGYIHTNSYEECVKYVHECAKEYKGAVILYSGKDFHEWTMDTVSLLAEQVLLMNDGSLQDNAQMWGNLDSISKALIPTRKGVIVCMEFHYKHSRSEEEHYLMTVEKLVLEMKQTHDVQNMSDEQIVRMVHDYICNNFDYDLTYSNYTAYDGFYNLIEGEQRMVCQGYSLLAYQLLNRLGIETKVLISDVHSWNLVKVDGQWYHLDITNDDRGVFDMPVIYKYYLRASLNGQAYEYKTDSSFYKGMYGITLAEQDYAISRDSFLNESLIPTFYRALKDVKENAFYIVLCTVLILLMWSCYEMIDRKVHSIVMESRKKFDLYNSI